MLRPCREQSRPPTGQSGDKPFCDRKQRGQARVAVVGQQRAIQANVRAQHAAPLPGTLTTVDEGLKPRPPEDTAFFSGINSCPDTGTDNGTHGPTLSQLGCTRAAPAETSYHNNTCLR